MSTEKHIKIKLSKKFSLYGKFTGSFRKPLFIIVHGLGGNMDEDFYLSAARWFQKRGFSTFRFNLYGPQKDARQLMDCTLNIHARDLDGAIHYFRKRGVKKIFAAGHSFGGLTILYSHNQNFEAAVLWDPSYKMSFTKQHNPRWKYIPSLQGYITHWGVNIVIGNAMVKENDSLNWNLIGKDFAPPLKIILAGKGILKGAKKYFDNASGKKNLLLLKDATHYFNDKKGMREKVFKASENWFRKFL